MHSLGLTDMIRKVSPAKLPTPEVKRLRRELGKIIGNNSPNNGTTIVQQVVENQRTQHAVIEAVADDIHYQIYVHTMRYQGLEALARKPWGYGTRTSCDGVLVRQSSSDRWKHVLGRTIKIGKKVTLPFGGNEIREQVWTVVGITPECQVKIRRINEGQIVERITLPQGLQ